MKPGRTANIRINPKDCMSCIDVVKKTGINLQGASFAIIVSTALASMLESFRQNGLIPTRDGFEYAEIMATYPKQGRANHARALAISKTFEIAGSDIFVKPIAPGDMRKRQELDELVFKANSDPTNMSEEEGIRLKELMYEFNPL